MKDTKSPNDIEKLKRILYLLFNSHYAIDINFFHRTPKKDLTDLRMKLEIIKSEKPFIVFEKAPRTKGMTYVCLDLWIQNSTKNIVSKAKVTDDVASQFIEEIRKDGYILDIERCEKNFSVYGLN